MNTVADISNTLAGDAVRDGRATRVKGLTTTVGPASFDIEAQLAKLSPKVQEAAEKLVSSTFIRPMLEQMRKDPLKSDLFGGGMAQDTFNSMLDTEVADRITKASGFGIVKNIYDSKMKEARARLTGRARLMGMQIDRHG
ncbi:MAG: hypothetical protein GC164_05285 [Phycisphaera sp.]|nr:hypothetical protein [Phycisphaera sp.]